MPHKSPEARKKYRQQYHLKNKAKQHKQMAAWRTINAASIKKRMVIYCKKNEANLKIQGVDYRRVNAAMIQRRRRDTKQQAMDHYGSVCPCGEQRLGALTLDHKNQDGAAARRDGCPGSGGLYSRLRKLKYPPGYRVLCSNCNFKAYRDHVRNQPKSKSKSATHHRKRTERLKIEFFSKLGNRCITCARDDIEILTAHHINGDGAAHRKALGIIGGGTKFYEAILKSGNFGGLECRCFSCNDAEEWGVLPEPVMRGGKPVEAPQ